MKIRPRLHTQLHWLLLVLLAGLMAGCTQSDASDIQPAVPKSDLLPKTEQPVFLLFFTDN